MQINLDELFRQDSAARSVAERLMTGKPMSRQDLIDGLTTAVTTVNRVVEALRGAGVIVTREVATDGKSAIFQVVEVREPKTQRPFPNIVDELRLVGLNVSGDDMLVDFKVEKWIYRGVIKGMIFGAQMGSTYRVTGIDLIDDRLADIRIVGPTGNSVMVEAVRNVTAKKVA